jgi:eukaryotic-like serine/threonine-protein kinase
MAPNDDDGDETSRSRSPLSVALSRLDKTPVTPQPAPRTFVPDDVVAGRYRVIRFIARGGMGEVYEVDDSELGQRVAMKTIRADLADDESLLARFRTEISLARRVTHHNVCRLFDVGFHDSPRGRITFLTMELLDGESLRKRLKVKGPLPPAEALPIVEQMAAGLGAAHAFGVVHRDFKSDNVMLVPSPSGPPRVVITDFGLARSQDSASTLGQGKSGDLKGTPAYMAPEQLANEPVGAPADIYALGVVMFEMTTGQLPFTGDNPMLAAIKRLTVPPTPPRQLQPGLDRRWEAIILRCLQREPADRFARAEDVARALHDESFLPRRRRRLWLIAPALLALGGAALLMMRAHNFNVRSHHKSAQAFATLGLVDVAGKGARDSAWLGTALTELVAAELRAQESLARVPQESVAALERELPALADARGELPPELLARVGATLHAELAVSGTFRDDGGLLTFDVDVRDTATGERVAAAHEEGRESALPDLAARAGGILRRQLGLRQLSAADDAEARQSLPANPEAARLYAEGIARLRLLDARGAEQLLQRAAAAAPDHPLLHEALSQVYRQLGRHDDETREAELAFAHTSSLPRELQLSVEGNLREARRQWPRAIELARALYDFYPGSIAYATRLAEVQVLAGQAKDALATLASAERDIPAAAHDPLLQLLRATSYDAIGDSQHQDVAAQAALADAQKLGARELQGQALLDEAMAALTLGDRPRAAARAAAAYEIFAGTNNQLSIARALRIRGQVAWKASRLVEARQLLQQAVTILEALGNGGQLARALNNLAGIESDLDHHDEAMRIYRRALPLFAEAADRNGLATVHLNLGQQLHDAGDLDASLAEEESALAETRATGQHRTEGIALESLGNLYIDRGELEKAADTERQAVALATEIHDATTMAQTRAKLGVALGDLGQTAAAKATLQQAIGELDALGERWRAGKVETSLARLMLALDDAAAAETLARRADGRLTAAHVDSGGAAAVLARALVALGRVAEARQAIDRALTHGDDARVQSAAAEVELAEHHPERALERLAKLKPPAMPERLEAELVTARAEFAVGKSRAAHARLTALLAEARARHFALVAKAAAALDAAR